MIDDGTTPIEQCQTFHCYIDHALILGEPDEDRYVNDECQLCLRPMM